MVEVEIYKSIREVGKNYGGRGVNKKLSPQKQRIANEIRTTRKCPTARFAKKKIFGAR